MKNNFSNLDNLDNEFIKLRNDDKLDRLKQAGMRWSVDGANYLITLRCMVESEHWSEIEKIVVEYFNH